MDDAGRASAPVQGPRVACQRGKHAGPVTTPILKEFRQIFGDPRVDDDIARVGRAGSAPDIAPAVLFLCSDGARWINGANLPVDGGPRGLDQCDRARVLTNRRSRRIARYIRLGSMASLRAVVYNDRSSGARARDGGVR